MYGDHQGMSYIIYSMYWGTVMAWLLTLVAQMVMANTKMRPNLNIRTF
jgi:hypothetical protein